MHRSHYYFRHNYCFHRFEWALHLSSTASDSLRQGLLLWVKLGIKKEGIWLANMGFKCTVMFPDFAGQNSVNLSKEKSREIIINKNTNRNLFS